MSGPLYVVFYDGRNPDGTTCTQVLKRDDDGDYRWWLSMDRWQTDKAREMVRGLNELEKRRARDRRERARRARERSES